MEFSETEIGEIVIKLSEQGKISEFMFEPLQLEHSWQVRRILCKPQQEELIDLVEKRGLTLVGSNIYSSFRVAVRLSLNQNGDISRIEKMALIDSDEFLEVIY